MNLYKNFLNQMQMAYHTSDDSRDLGEAVFRTTFLFNNLVFKRVGRFSICDCERRSEDSVGSKFIASIYCFALCRRLSL
jgi:hypothetical protein